MTSRAVDRARTHVVLTTAERTASFDIMSVAPEGAEAQARWQVQIIRRTVMSTTSVLAVPDVRGKG